MAQGPLTGAAATVIMDAMLSEHPLAQIEFMVGIVREPACLRVNQSLRVAGALCRCNLLTSDLLISFWLPASIMGVRSRNCRSLGL